IGESVDGRLRVFFKREDVRRETPEVEIAVAQAYLASRLGKKAVIAGNDVDDFSIALAAVAPKFGLAASIVLKPEDEKKTTLIEQLRSHGAAVDVAGGKGKDPREAALRVWQKDVERTHLALSFALGPHPYPQMMNDFQILLGYETDLQMRAKPGEA